MMVMTRPMSYGVRLRRLNVPSLEFNQFSINLSIYLVTEKN